MKCMHCNSRPNGCKFCNPNHPEYVNPRTVSVGSSLLVQTMKTLREYLKRPSIDGRQPERQKMRCELAELLDRYDNGER